MATNDNGLLLIGHGTRDEQGLKEFRSVAAQLADACPHLFVQHCFLELAEPTIHDGIAACARRGVRRLMVQPLLLFSAGHDQRDIPHALASASREFPQLELISSPPLGCHPHVLELSELRFTEAIRAHPPVDDADTMLLMVGRGSRDAEANSQMARFARLRWERRALGWVDSCYLAMTWPTLADGLAMAANSGKRRVVVQPHLLFRGELLARIESETAAAAKQHPQQQWLIAPHLGPHPLLVRSLNEVVQALCEP